MKWLWDPTVVLWTRCVAVVVSFFLLMSVLASSVDPVTCPAGTQKIGQTTCGCPVSTPYPEPPVQTAKP